MEPVILDSRFSALAGLAIRGTLEKYRSLSCPTPNARTQQIDETANPHALSFVVQSWAMI
jgi:hypothetical protein